MEYEGQLTKAERRAVERHQKRLSEERGYEVSFEEALDHWRTHCARKWRAERHARALDRQREEIQRHKWIESEKAQRDLGTEAALDWIRKYAAQWRQWYEEEYEDCEV